MKCSAVQDFIKKLNLPVKELKISVFTSFLFFEIGGEPYYIKINTLES